ncbi:ubiquitin carboxyl-terminal hydrolase 21-like isoform X2 [Phoenix dactylifera]|uniref:Ubiquitin carboxyl-terminal hydrolase 21-like isoform X2 n=1 Tax=Phoenix dactylifera TaxID=42345 RepID=A0A8B8Z9V8_PHODC|nr:ubiquitin carboxyl-terminal hydrolase 21-like isoform X2 [Phoenix dactylifera]
MEAGSLPPEDSRPLFGAGLNNIWNTCFLNAVLQCLTHTVPLVEKLRASDHYSTCSAGPGEFCALCALRHHIDNCLYLSGYVFTPKHFASNLSKILSEFELGSQEDAHEFLQCLLIRVHDCCIGLVSGNQLLSVGDDTDSLIKQVFGGRAISRLRCSDCGHVSDTFESLLDLSLGIDGMASLTEALESYTKVEMLEPSECDGCHAKVPKEKQLKLDQAPQVALFHLKRFKMDGAGVCKINNLVEFPLDLDLQPFLSSPQDELNYDLYAVVVHHGNMDRGHYFSFIRSSQSSWHLMDDADVARCSAMQVLNMPAYMLFYIKQGSSPWISSFIRDWRDKNFGFGESSRRSSSMDSPETREDQSPGTDDTPESVIYEVEGDSSSSAPLRPCNQGGISYGAEKKPPLDEVMKQSAVRFGSEECIFCVGVFNEETSTSLTEDDQEDHQESHGSSMDVESTAKEATKDRAGNEMLGSIPSLQRSSFRSCLTPPHWSHIPRPLILRNPLPMKRQRRALSDLDNIPSPSPVTPEVNMQPEPQSLLHQHDFFQDNS